MNKKKLARLHQKEAREIMRLIIKGIINLPTGTGKSFIQTLVTIDNLMNGGVQVILSPRILLADQLLHEIRADLDAEKIDCQYLIVHSGLTEDTRDLSILKDLAHRDMIPTTSPKEIKEQYEKAVREGVPLIISGTYHSAARLIQAGIPISVIHCDEAHYLIQPEFHWIASDLFHSDKKYFYTATMKHTLSDKGRGMNNKELFGEVIYSKLPIEMIHAGEILRPRMHLIDIPIDENLTDDNELNVDVNAIISAFTQHRSVCNIAPKMLITTKGSEHQNDIVNHTRFQEFLSTRPNLKVFDITSEYKPRINNIVVKRSNFFKQLRALTDFDEAIILHIKILTEGIDVPGITGVMLMNNPTLSQFLQNLGRATRLHLLDRLKLYAGTMKPDELKKFIKPYAYVIVPKYGFLGAEINQGVRTMVQALRKYDFNPIEHVIMADSRGHVEPVELGSLLKKDKRAQSILNEFVEMVNEIEEEEKANELDMEQFNIEQQTKSMSIDQLINSFSEF